MMKKRLYRSERDRKLYGVCGGIADYLDLDPAVIRLLWVVLSVFSAGAGLIIYIAACFLLPSESEL